MCSTICMGGLRTFSDFQLTSSKFCIVLFNCIGALIGKSEQVENFKNKLDKELEKVERLLSHST